MAWKVYINTTNGHFKYYSIELSTFSNYTGRVIYGKIGQMGTIKRYDPDIIENKINEKLSRGYVLLGIRPISYVSASDVGMTNTTPSTRQRNNVGNYKTDSRGYFKIPEYKRIEFESKLSVLELKNKRSLDASQSISSHEYYNHLSADSFFNNEKPYWNDLSNINLPTSLFVIINKKMYRVSCYGH